MFLSTAHAKQGVYLCQFFGPSLSTKNTSNSTCTNINLSDEIENMCHVKNPFHFNHAYFRTVYVLFVPPPKFIHCTFKNKTRLKLKDFVCERKYSTFLCKSVLCNYVIISLQCIAYVHL